MMTAISLSITLKVPTAQNHEWKLTMKVDSYLWINISWLVWRSVSSRPRDSSETFSASKLVEHRAQSPVRKEWWQQSRQQKRSLKSPLAGTKRCVRLATKYLFTSNCQLSLSIFTRDFVQSGLWAWCSTRLLSSFFANGTLSAMLNEFASRKGLWRVPWPGRNAASD